MIPLIDEGAYCSSVGMMTAIRCESTREDRVDLSSRDKNAFQGKNRSGEEGRRACHACHPGSELRLLQVGEDNTWGGKKSKHDIAQRLTERLR